MKPVTVSLIIHEDFSHIRTALASMLEHTDCPMQIHITINSGCSKNVDALRDEFPYIKMYVNEKPLGFASNHNAILRLAETDYVVLINDDVEAAPHMLDKLISYLEQHPDVGLASPRVLNSDGTPQIMAFSDPSLLRMIYKISGLGYFTRQGTSLRRIAARRFPRLASFQMYTETQTVPVAAGVVMCVRRTAYEQAGVMDEDTLVYGEEVAWHWRLRQHGWQIALVAETSVIHFNTEQLLRGWSLVEHRKGMLNYFIRYRPSWQALLLRGAILFLHSIRGMSLLLIDRRLAATEWQTALTALLFEPKR